MANPEKLVYRVREAMEAIAVLCTTIYRLVKRGELRLIKIGSTRSSGISAESINAMIGIQKPKAGYFDSNLSPTYAQYKDTRRIYE